jgi:hypothetical protein
MSDPIQTRTTGGDDDAPLVPTHQVATVTTLDGPPAAETLYPPEGPAPEGLKPGEAVEMAQGADAPAATGVGIEGEEVVWEARYSMKNFLARIALRVVLTAAWLILAFETWVNGRSDFEYMTGILGLALLLFWLILAVRMVQARFGHFYRLTNRRLFVSTGLARRRRDQMELLRVKDVYTRQNLLDRWLSIGTVVVVSQEKELPIFYIAGVNDPQEVMDLIWHHARAERDNRGMRVDTI